MTHSWQLRNALNNEVVRQKGGKQNEEQWPRIWFDMVHRLAVHHRLCGTGMVENYSRDSGLAFLPGPGGRVKDTKPVYLAQRECNNLTPFIPLSLKGEGERECLKGRSPFKLAVIGDGEKEE